MIEAELIERAREGDAGAIQALYRRHAPHVYAIIRRLTGEDALAEDWAQEAWVRAIRALPGFRGECRFSTWLHQIAVNCALAARRWRARRAGREAPLSEAIPEEPAGEATLIRVRLERALARLPDGMRQVLVLHDIEGYTHEEIAQILGITPGTSRSQLFKARARMRELLRRAPAAVNGEEVCRI